jgi:uncharacterized membrane protein YkgB
MENENKLYRFEQTIIDLFNKINLPLARFAIFLVYFWFGILKVFDLSPASPMVLELLKRTMPFFPPAQFLIFFGLFEMLIGILFLVPRYTKVAIVLLFIHMATTVGPLFIMPTYIWDRFLVPTMEGQYIIKNILIIALAVILGSKLPSRLGEQSRSL